MKNKKIIVIGGDGFYGWPLSLRLSNIGYDVVIFDNLSRRRIDKELNFSSLVPIYNIEERIETWTKLTNKKLIFEYVDTTNYNLLKKNILKYQPDVIIHLGEQRAAPYSMKNANTRNYTVFNNIIGTHNILNSIVELELIDKVHFIHLGTMGVYGYGSVPDTIIPEGYVDIKIRNKDNEWMNTKILHPHYPGSIYHMTKCQDALLFNFYVKNYSLKITDLHQGIVWGVNTPETDLHEKLNNRFDYDSDYGTVLNRFIMQAVCKIPLTIYGTGEQTRAFIHLHNSLDCMIIAINNPPTEFDKPLIFNQMTETKNLLFIKDTLLSLYPNMKEEYLSNPRKELVSNELDVDNNKFLKLGLNTKLINETEIRKIIDHIKPYINNINKEVIMPLSYWK